jgi:hypothetical protein
MPTKEKRTVNSVFSLAESIPSNRSLKTLGTRPKVTPACKAIPNFSSLSAVEQAKIYEREGNPKIKSLGHVVC